MTTPDGDAARRTNRSSAEVRQGLLDAAARLVRERGVAAVTYRDIAAEAGTSDSVLLRHFGTKNELIADAVIEPFTASLAEMVRKRRDGPADPDPVRARRTFLTELHEALSGNRSVVRALLAAEASGADDPVLAPGRARLREVLAALAEVSRAGGGAADPAGGTAQGDHELTARVVIAMVVAATALDDVLFAVPAGPPSPGALVTALTVLTTHGRAGTG
jgi:TetR/AcrR family transcriptional repressor of nem operon